MNVHAARAQLSGIFFPPMLYASYHPVQSSSWGVLTAWAVWTCIPLVRFWKMPLRPSSLPTKWYGVWNPSGHMLLTSGTLWFRGLFVSVSSGGNPARYIQVRLVWWLAKVCARFVVVLEIALLQLFFLWSDLKNLWEMIYGLCLVGVGGTRL